MGQIKTNSSSSSAVSAGATDKRKYIDLFMLIFKIPIIFALRDMCVHYRHNHSHKYGIGSKYTLNGFHSRITK